MFKRLALALVAALLCASAHAQTASQIPPAKACFTGTVGETGVIGTLGSFTPGLGSGTSGTYHTALLGGAGSGATATITVAGGIVISQTLDNDGQGYAIGDVLTASPAAIGGIVGYSTTVASTALSGALAGGTVTFYVPGTTNPKSTWQDAGEVTLNPNPVILDGNGCALIYGVGTYRQIVRDNLGNVVWDQPTQVPGSGGTATVHVANLAALQAYSTTAGAFVHRDAYSVPGDGGGADYTNSALSCASRGYVNDGGGCVNVNTGGSWLIVPSPGNTVDGRVWGASVNASDNAPFFGSAMAWCAVVLGCDIKLPAGKFVVASTFDCAYASGMTFEGVGNATVIYRSGNYGHTMTCGGTGFVQNVAVKNMWFYHFIGDNPIAAFVNPTTGFGTGYNAAGSAHFKFVSVNNFVFDHVTSWNMNFNYMIIDCINGNWETPLTFGFWNASHNQTKASFYFDGADGEFPDGHSQSMHIHSLLSGGYLNTASTVFGSGWTSNTIANFRFSQGAYDDILVKSLEGLIIDGGNAAVDAFYANLELRPQGVAGKPIIQIHSNGYWYDNAHFHNVAIDNFDGGANCANPNMSAVGVEFNGGMFNGEFEALNAIYVANNACPSAVSLNVEGVEAVAFVDTPYLLGGVQGGQINGGSIRAYNISGVNFANVATSSAVWTYGTTSNFTTSNVQVGGDAIFTQPATAVGYAQLFAGGTGWTANGTGTATYAGPDCGVNPVINIATSPIGTISATSMANGGSCTRWPSINSSAWTIAGVAGGALPQFALSPLYTASNVSIFGVSTDAGLTNVKRVNINNVGYYQDYVTQQIICTGGVGTPTNSIGADNRHVTISTLSGSGAVTTGACSFYGALSTLANVGVTATDAITAGGTPVSAAVTSIFPGGFSYATSASIGGGGRITFTINPFD